MALRLGIMSDVNEARAIRYLLDGLDDKDMIECALEKEIYSQALFHAQQLAEKSTKACISILQMMPTDEHHYTKSAYNIVLPNAKKLRGRFEIIIPQVTRFELQYIPTRYGVSTSGKIYLREYNQDTILRDIKSANEYLELCFQFVENRVNMKIPRDKKELKKLLMNAYSDNVYKLSSE